ncbi:MarR family winged helix-turn-helix transcriptional regulator [Paraburkholderia kururiensis]|uniref:MarR family winged helix-turn-helix transcriptional regulator n=1 Tax=Paraburkholderia kururiensis TaxID=984307 RepID=UPI0003464807|nr:MarR family transcriptional regulator [Paraburkholderia kururiensis]
MKHYNRENFPVTENLGFFINRARNLAAAEMDEALKPMDITSQHVGILLALSRGMAHTPYELSKRLGMDTGLMTRALDKLEVRGLLTRSRSAEDRRVVNLKLTPMGDDIAGRIPDIASEVLNRRLQGFTKAEFKEFLRLLRKFSG